MRTHAGRRGKDDSAHGRAERQVEQDISAEPLRLEHEYEHRHHHHAAAHAQQSGEKTDQGHQAIALIRAESPLYTAAEIPSSGSWRAPRVAHGGARRGSEICRAMSFVTSRGSLQRSAQHALRMRSAAPLAPERRPHLADSRPGSTRRETRRSAGRHTGRARDGALRRRARCARRSSNRTAVA